MVQTWNNFCFTTGYIEIAITFPGPNQEAHGYVSIPYFDIIPFRPVIPVFALKWSGISTAAPPPYEALTGRWISMFMT